MARNSFAFFEKLEVGDFVEVVNVGCFNDNSKGKIAKVIKKEKDRVVFSFPPIFKYSTGINAHSRNCHRSPKLKKLDIKNKRDLEAYLIAQQI